MHGFKNVQSPSFQLPVRVARPRFLRAIPSLVVLTTAMAWGATSQAGVLGLDGVLRTNAGVTIAAGPELSGGAGASLGANTGGNAGSGAVKGNAAISAGAGGVAVLPAAANGNVTSDEPAQRTDAAGTSVGVQGGGEMQAPGAVNRATDGAGRALGAVRGTAKTNGSDAAEAVNRATQGVRGGVGSGKHRQQSAVDASGGASAGGDANLGVGSQEMTKKR